MNDAIGRVIKGIGGNYYVLADGAEYTCNARGLFRLKEIEPLAGDFVELSNIDNSNKTALIQDILPRKNFLMRPKVANVDLVVCVGAVLPRLNPELIDALLFNCKEQGVDALVCINKTDMLENPMDLPELKGWQMAGYPAIALSAATGAGIDELGKYISNKTVIFAGNSGVGKSSIINALMPDLDLAIGDLSRKIGRGKHTTRETRLIAMGGGFLVDSPGFSTLSIDKIPPADLQNYYPEFAPYRENCYYQDCQHITEHDCAIKDEVGETIHPGRYERYVKYVTERGKK